MGDGIRPELSMNISWTPVLLVAALIHQLLISIIQRGKDPVLLYLVHLCILMVASEPLHLLLIHLTLKFEAP